MTTMQPVIDWSEVAEQATDLLCRYIQIDTTNPPGGEEAGAVFLRDALGAEGIGSTLYDAGDGRVSLAARLNAETSNKAKPLVLLSHIDVVPVEAEHWRVDPFSGSVIDGTIWGRGALDMKGMGIMELMVLALVKRHRLPLDRDIVLVAVADEEEGGHRGVHHLLEVAPELFDAEWVFNEGAYGFCEFLGQKVTMFGLGPSEKSPCWLKLRSHGAPGHASVPHSNNALARLVKALARVEAREQHVRVTPVVEAMFRTLVQRGLVPADVDIHYRATLEAIAGVDAHLGALTTDTISITGVHSGHKHNVIPVSAEATLDCRILPDIDADDFVAELVGVIDDPEIEIERVLQHDSGVSSLDTPVSVAVAEAVSRKFGDQATVVPMLTPGFTDSHAFRASGAQAYGFTPALLNGEELATIHGHNERISVDNLVLGTEILFDVVQRLTCPRSQQE